MMSWVSDWFGFGGEPLPANAPASVAAIASSQRQGTVGYSQLLVSRLCSDHSLLLDMLQALASMAEEYRLIEIPAALNGFKAKFDVHLLNENLRFYCYLEEQLADEELDAAREFRAEMDALAPVVARFVQRHQRGIAAQDILDFETELRDMTAMLVDRMQREEAELYPLYRP